MKTTSLSAKTVALVCALGLTQSALAQSNLILNGDFSSGAANWNNNLNGAYYYFENAVATNIVSMGWTSGLGLWQDTGSLIQTGDSYALSVTAQVGQTPMTGLNLSFQDVTTGWTWLANQNFAFTSQTSGPGQWQTFTLNIPSSALAGLGGHDIGVGIQLYESPNTQYGWVWAQSVSLIASPVPEPSSMAMLGVSALGGFTLLRLRKK